MRGPGVHVAVLRYVPFGKPQMVLGDALRQQKQGARLSFPQGRYGDLAPGDDAMKQKMPILPIVRSLSGLPAI